MTVLVTIVVAGALGVWYDRRANRHGWRAGRRRQLAGARRFPIFPSGNGILRGHLGYPPDY
jgi:hypothetical protein